ncbi:hypothetical protein [Alteromonas macleodii]|uniref:hypothetical protein n=1 Tax=Alteromonas macleodii TaxID=28108 RepID=UPI0001AEBB05|nr:hypothetical protein [Alteromonas macleodii]AFS38151.1 hypothetical protein MASE_13195 [Alteromonas macleodii ATCC 27126]
MLIFNVPIKASDSFRIVADWISNLVIKPVKKNANAKFHFVYFSYKPDFDYLNLSIQSLVNHIDSEKIGSVNLFVDQKAPFNTNQIDKLKKICPKLAIHRVYEFAWASTETTMAEITSFLKVCENAEEHDFIVKVDSDILFFRNKRLSRMLTSKYDAVGDGHHLQYKYAQGGLYMIRAAVIRDVFNTIEKKHVKEVELHCGTKGEDRVISTLLAQAESPFYLTRLMLFPDEYKIMKKLPKLVRWEFCAKHFVKDKHNMSKSS